MKLLQPGIIWREDIKLEFCVVMPRGKARFMCSSASEVLQRETNSDNKRPAGSLFLGSNTESVLRFQWSVCGSNTDLKVAIHRELVLPKKLANGLIYWFWCFCTSLERRFLRMT